MNAKKLFTTLAICVAMSLQTALMAATITPSKRYVTAPVKVSTSFTGLCTETSIDIEYTVGPQKVSIYAPDNLMKYVKVAVSRGMLIVSYTENMNINGKHKTKLVVSAPDVTNFSVKSAGDIKILSNIKTSANVKLSVMSAGDIEARDIYTTGDVICESNSAGEIEAGNISGRNVRLSVRSAGDIEVGTVKAQKEAILETISAGDAKAKEMIAGVNVIISSISAGDVSVGAVSSEEVKLTASSVGDAKADNVEATKVYCEISNKGDVKVTGFCSEAYLNVFGSGSIYALDLEATDVFVDMTSNGDIKCAPIRRLFGSHMGSGTLYYSGAPMVTVSSSSRSGDKGVRHI